MDKHLENKEKNVPRREVERKSIIYKKQFALMAEEVENSHFGG